MNLDNLKDISRIDKENMLDLLVSFPKQCKDAISIGEAVRINSYYKKSYSNIVFTGLGGSAIGADVIKGYLETEIKVPLVVNRNYGLAQFVNEDSLVFTVSYSGNTEETLSAYADAVKKNANIVVITSGGKLGELALKNKNILATIPGGYPPRCALGYSFIPALVLLSKLGFVKNKKNEIKKSATFLNTLQKKYLAPDVKEKTNISKGIAKKIYGKFVAIYASSRLESIVMRWRGQFAENSKTLSSSHVFPEMNHNEIVGWMNPEILVKHFAAVILRDKDDNARIKKRMNITK